ncbi:MAG: archaemetzincin family Zn-dependent metalloprotease [Candidatus Micrarchaeota archaeon]
MKILLVELEAHFPQSSHLKTELNAIFKKELSLHHSILRIPHEFFNLQKQKWDAERIIGFLHEKFQKTQEGKFMVLALFPYDLYADSLNFVYGLGERGGNYAVISYFRLSEHFYGRNADEKLFSGRILKEAMHEIGHMAGIEHCRNKKCVMAFSPNIIFVDRKKAEFCGRCKLFL